MSRLKVTVLPSMTMSHAVLLAACLACEPGPVGAGVVGPVGSRCPPATARCPTNVYRVEHVCRWLPRSCSRGCPLSVWKVQIFAVSSTSHDSATWVFSTAAVFRSLPTMIVIQVVQRSAGALEGHVWQPHLVGGWRHGNTMSLGLTNSGSISSVGVGAGVGAAVGAGAAVAGAAVGAIVAAGAGCLARHRRQCRTPLLLAPATPRPARPEARSFLVVLLGKVNIFPPM